MGLLSVAGVQVDIKGNLAPLRRDLQAAERELGAFARGVSGAGTGMQGGSFNAANTTASGFFSTLRSGAQDIFFMTNAAQQMYSAFAKPFKAADDLAQLGYEAERARIALTNTLGSAEEYEKWMRAIKDATHGTITETEAAGMAYQVLRLGLATTADEAREFVRMATIIGQASPQLTGASDAIGEISLTIANMSWRRLDQLGLSVSEVKARMEELRTLNSDLTTEEAFQTAVLEGLTEQANMLGDELLEVGAATQRWKVAWQDIKTDIGWKIGEGFDGAIIAAESLYEILRVMTQEPWKLQFALGGLPDWAVNAMQAGTTGRGVITNQYDDVLGRQQSIIGSAGQRPSQRATNLTPMWGDADMMLRAQMLLGSSLDVTQRGGLLPKHEILDASVQESVNAYYDAYYAAQERALLQARDDARARLRMYGTGGGMDTLMLIAGLELGGAALSPDVRQSVNAYYDAYYRAQEEAIARTSTLSRSRVTRYLPNYKELGAAATGPLPQFPESSYLTTLGQHGGSLAHIFARGLGLPTDRSGVPMQDAYQKQYWQQYYTQGGWQGGDVQPWQVDPATRRTREQLEANRARYAEQQRMAQMRAFREADAASYADPRQGRFGGLPAAWYGVTEALRMMPDMADMVRQQQAYQDMLTRRAAPPRAQSLDEFFQISPERLDTEVYSVMEDALDEAGVNAKLAAEALKLFEWQTGMTTPTAELFNAQVEVLTQKLGTGEVTAAQFADAMALLAQTDLSPLSLLWEADLKAGDWEAVTNTIDRLSKIDLSALHLMTSPMTDAGLRTDTESMLRDMWEPGVETYTAGEGGAASPLQALQRDAENALETIQRLPTEGVDATQQFSEGATSWFETWSSESLPYIDTINSELANIEDRIGRLTMMPFVVTLSVNDPGGGAPAAPSGAPRYGGRAITPFAEGGFTGVGSPNEVAGIVHKGEYVVPRGGALVLDRSASKGTPTIVVQQLNTFGDWRGAVRQLEQAAQDAGYRLEVR